MADESAQDPFPTEADVDGILAEFHGDHRAAIRALLHDIAALAADYGSSVSRGYVRRGVTVIIQAGRSARGTWQ